ncbi:conserved hypothetical protein [Flavobacteria bacterium MS024-3C]|jgi:hypothetical protein|nr:conserved hypothetical protein [Flavobacteria bacterium MS024-3C]MBT4840213.1 hypothetical protein [Flavobacteriaceae bacterium]MDA8973086.1 hypothetical protein [bacterium]MBT5394518.1 hypothetical protein [Flavobacteriaceae bacterium]MBT5585153.1 hypothetical protein [Flavobacteriaceae bacterium]|tara:strand:- start:440 stop:862 length:423 start_codon:yes stop_codon:yes gene_type:complete
MQKHLYLLLLLTVITACKSSIQEGEISRLEGYWEITKVVFQDGTTKPYTVNTTVDYIGIDGFNGYIKKMKPGLNGRYQTSNKAAQFKLIQKDGLWEMHFEGDQKSTLSLLELDSLEYAVKDQGQVRYYYKRYEPININDE